MIPASEALARLQEGNRRFAAGKRRRHPLVSQARRHELLQGQTPFAAILGCSDSRAPVEIIFDQDLGDLFVIRVAGNIVASSLIGSVEFAAERFGTRLVVVLGHSLCGAVQATLEELQQQPEEGSHNLRSITSRIRPAIEGLLADDEGHDPERLLRRAIQANVRASVAQLRHGSEILERLVSERGLLIVGAKYSLRTGLVEFLEEPADPR